MSESTGKGVKRYVYIPRDRSKPTCHFHGPCQSSDECKVFGDFGSKYSKRRHTKDCRHNPATRNKFNRQKENNAIVNNSVDEILLQENNKVVAEAEAHQDI